MLQSRAFQNRSLWRKTCFLEPSGTELNFSFWHFFIGVIFQLCRLCLFRLNQTAVLKSTTPKQLGFYRDPTVSWFSNFLTFFVLAIKMFSKPCRLHSCHTRKWYIRLLIFHNSKNTASQNALQWGKISMHSYSFRWEYFHFTLIISSVTSDRYMLMLTYTHQNLESWVPDSGFAIFPLSLMWSN